MEKEKLMNKISVDLLIKLNLYLVNKSGVIMKYLVTVLSFSFVSLFAKENTTYLKVDGMQCSYSCSGKVSTIVQNIKGVKECDVDFDKGIATVVYDDKKLNSKDIVDGLLNKTSYKVSELEKKEVLLESTEI